jgi:hypothetical protein
MIQPAVEGPGFEQPIEFRRLQLQLMTVQKLQGHLDMLQSNIETIPRTGKGPICPNAVEAMIEARANVARTGSHLDPAAMDALRAQLKLQLPEITEQNVQQTEKNKNEEHKKQTGEHLDAMTLDALGKAIRKVHGDPRVVESLVEEAYFRSVLERMPSFPPELCERLQRAGTRAIAENEEDRQRWMNTALQPVWEARKVRERQAQKKRETE